MTSFFGQTRRFLSRVLGTMGLVTAKKKEQCMAKKTVCHMNEQYKFL